MESQKKRILIIEDDRHIAEGLELNLAIQGYEVVVAADGVAGLNKWREVGPDLVILDIMLPGIDGLSILQSIRLEDERLPILILSAKGDPDDRIKGLAFGVDDYLAKPFSFEELLARLRVARHVQGHDQRAGGHGAAGQEDGGLFEPPRTQLAVAVEHLHEGGPGRDLVQPCEPRVPRPRGGEGPRHIQFDDLGAHRPGMSDGSVGRAGIDVDHRREPFE